MTATALDNWSWEGANLTLFKEYLAKFGGRANVNILEADFKTTGFTKIGSYNIMFYDGSHNENDQRDGVKLPVPAMDHDYIVIVDDWNWDHVRRGTFRGLREANCTINNSIEVRIKTDPTSKHNLPTIHGPSSEWHNGMFVAVVSKLK